uniref:Uncharacterized protein n=1 Tax=Chromera velia CCMP2878 TaxID=1169474 RepID=A0A0G4IF87_9ALVE|eukprot:Cvel_13836.t1-p1 / transcript=Cvel_13836.t1 / gene=Cvel_13836 / organism=Chromera_velia_CCMP2878 / gene_product=hypothetical protein / transcript_product=hypothetical protein / location=Cvel_scaffold961:20815-23507(-) / protein_length=768 / sequence_SO=supercontig / SO=protein_coding / is_pseudo=false
MEVAESPGGGESFTDEERVVVIDGDGEDVVTIAIVSPPSAAATGFGVGGRQDVFPPSAAATGFGVGERQDVFRPSAAAIRFGVGGWQDVFPPSAAATGFGVGEQQNVFSLSAAATGFGVGGRQDAFPPSAAATGIGVGLGGGESFTDKERVIVVDGEDVVTIETEPPIRDSHARDPGLGVFPPSAVVSPPSAAATGFGVGGRQDVFPPSAAATGFGVGGRQDVFPPSAAATGFGVGGRQDVFRPSAAAIRFGVGGRQDVFPPSAAATGFGVGEQQNVFPLSAAATGFGVGGRQDVFPPSAAATGIGVGLGGGKSFTDEERVVVVDGEDMVTIETEPPIRDCHARDPGLGVFPPSAVVSPPSAPATGFGVGGRQDVFPPSAAATGFGVGGQQDVFPPSAAATGFGVGERQDVFPPSAAAIRFGVGGRQDVFPPSAAATGFGVGEQQNVFPLSAAATGFGVGGRQDVFPPSAAATGFGVGLGGGESVTDKERVVVVDGEDVVTIETEPPIRDSHARDPGLGVFPPSAVVSPPSAAATGFGVGGRQDVFPPSAAATGFGVGGRQDVFPPSAAATGFGVGGRQDVFPPSAAATGFGVGGRQDVFPPSAAATGFGVGLGGGESVTDKERVVVVDGEDVVTIETEPPIRDSHARDPGLGVFPPSAVVSPPSAAATGFGVEERQAVSECPINKKAPAFGGRFEFNGYNSKRCRQSLIRAYFVHTGRERQTYQKALLGSRGGKYLKNDITHIPQTGHSCGVKYLWSLMNEAKEVIL